MLSGFAQQREYLNTTLGDYTSEDLTRLIIAHSNGLCWVCYIPLAQACGHCRKTVAQQRIRQALHYKAFRLNTLYHNKFHAARCVPTEAVPRWAAEQPTHRVPRGRGYPRTLHHAGHLSPGDLWRAVDGEYPRTAILVRRHDGRITLTDQYGITFAYPAAAVIPTAVRDALPVGHRTLPVHLPTRGTAA